MVQSDCIVLPTYYNEGVPHVLLEASALKIPVITTKIPGCMDAVDHNYNGFLCKPKNAYRSLLMMEKFLKLSPTRSTNGFKCKEQNEKRI